MNGNGAAADGPAANGAGAPGAMAPLPLPLRVLVKGASTVVWISYMGGPRTDFAYPRVIEQQLLSAGRPTEIHVTAVASQPTRELFRNWPLEVIAWSPDVLVLNYGHFECIHLFLPRWLERHANSLHQRPGRFRELYRHYGIRPLWKSLARAQARIDQGLDPKIHDRRRQRVERTLERFIQKVRPVGHPLILIPELPRPGSNWDTWFPGATTRVVAMNQMLRELVERIDDPDVRFVPLAERIAAQIGADAEVAPDGGHYTPTVHRIVGTALAEEILSWAAGQPHLTPSAHAPDRTTPLRDVDAEPDAVPEL